MKKIKELLTELPHAVIYETGGNKEYLSANIFELTGYYAEEIRMNRDLFPGLINPEDYIETNFKIKNWHKNNEPGVLIIQFRFQSSNGTQVWIEDHLIGLKIGETKFMRGIMMNITFEKNKETELLQLRTIWREKPMKDETERNIVFTDIQRQLDDLTKRATERKKQVEEILVYSKEKNLPFDSIGF